MGSTGWVGVFLALAALSGAAPPPALLHVSPRGDDSHPGTQEKPFATLQRAREAARELKRKDSGRPVTVLVQGGTYTLTSPLVFTPEDSGTKDAPVVYAAAGKERPLFSGGRRLTGWKEMTIGDKKLWVAELPDVRAGKTYFRQLWVNGQRRTRARHPNT